MSTVKELLDSKGRVVLSIDASASVYDAIVLMAEKNIGALMVSSGESQLAGIVSERDYARKVIISDGDPKETTVSEIMTPDVIFANEDTLLDKCTAIMMEKNIRHLPIVDNNSPVGMITLGDIMKTVIQQQSMTIEELESFMYEENGGEG